MKRFNTLVTLLILTLAIKNTQAQKDQYEVVISGGTGYAFSNTALKTTVNFGLKEAGLTSRVQTTWLVNGMIDVAIKKNLSIGIAYSHFQFSWMDAYNDTIQGIPTVVNANIDVQKRNYGIRGLYHFGNSENFEFYAGGRLGLTHWIFDVNADGSVAGKTPVSEFKIPATYPSIQLLGGFRHYFGRVFGWFGEIGVGTSPYTLSVGINIRPNPAK